MTHIKTPSKEQKKPKPALCFSFGEPESVLSSQAADYLATLFNDDSTPYYRPTVSFKGLATLLHSNPYHGAIIEFKTNLTCRHFKPSAALSRHALKAAVTDYYVFANSYFQKRRNHYGEVIALNHIPALTVRRMKQPDRFCVIKEEGRYTPAKSFRLKITM